MPQGAEILHVGTQGDKVVCFWALVENQNRKEIRTFTIHGTGHPLADNACAETYVGTSIQMNGRLVWHVFEVTKP